jgi:hypothetical protein
VAEIYPDLTFQTETTHMVLTLIVESSSGQRSDGVSIEIVKQGFIH